MARFNTSNAAKTTLNYAGGEAYTQSPESALASLLLTNFLRNQSYRTGSEALSSLQQLVAEVDPMFAAKAALYARHEYGMRSVSHVVAGELAHTVKEVSWSRDFYSKVVRRPDDITEIVAYYLAEHGKPLPNALKQGLADAFGKFDSYQLAKYRTQTSKLSLVDVVNLVHPKPTEKNKSALRELVDGTLRSENTWETLISAAGQDTERRRAAWTHLLETNTLGYFALLRNLRNIMTDAPDMIPLVCQQLTDEKRITHSLVLPFRFTAALKEIAQIPESRQVISALSQAIDISVQNCPKFDGKTLIAIDTSGSMAGRPSEIATLFGAALYKKNTQADLLLFDTDLHPITPNPNDSVTSIAASMPFHGGGTNLNIIFEYTKTAYDRIIILSDMQAWDDRSLYGWSYGSGNPKQALADYKRRTGANPKLYSFDLLGYGSLAFPEQNVYTLAGFSDKVFDLMQVLESGESLIDVIQKIEL